MKVLLLYEYPLTESSNSIQGSMLHRGLLELGVECRVGHYEQRNMERRLLLKTYRPDVVVGIGWWANTPEIILEPQAYGLQPVPWLLADGWVANYHSILSDLPLVFTTSTWVKEIYQRDGVDTKNFDVLHVGFDHRLFQPLSSDHPGVQEMRNMFGVLPHEKIILTVGGDVTSKGAQEVIRALAKIDKEFPHWKYVCKAYKSECSQNHHREEMRIIAETGINPNKFVYCENDFMYETMPLLLNACDIYVAPSRIEGFGLVQLEAMACGVPVVSIDAMGPKDIIIHGKTGFLAKVGSTVDLSEEWVTPEMGIVGKEKICFDKPKTLAYRADSTDIARYVAMLLKDEQLCKQIGTQAAQHAVSNFQYTHLAKRCLNIIKNKLRL